MSAKQQARERRKEYLEKRRELLCALRRKNGDWCNRCKKPLEVKEMTVDHIKALKNRGTNQMKNLQILCFACNQRKGSLKVHPDDIVGVVDVKDTLARLKQENTKNIFVRFIRKLLP